MSEVIKNHKLTWKKRIFIIMMLFIPISNFLIFWLGVNFNSILLAFKTESSTGIKWSFDNFLFVFNDITMPSSSLFPAFLNTMKFFLVSLLIILPLSVVLCYFIYKKILGYKVFRFIFYLPCVLSASVLAILVKYIIAKDGPVGELFMHLGCEPIPFLTDSRYAIWTLIFYNVFFSIGGNTILLSGAMTHINESVIEAAQLDGVGIIREMVQIIIPIIWPTLTSLIIFTFVGMFSASGPVLFFTQGEYKTNTIAYWIFNQVYSSGGNYNYAAAVGLLCTVIATPISLFIRRVLNKSVEVVES